MTTHQIARIVFSAVIILVVSAGAAAAQFSISGTVTDTFASPVVGADLRLFDDLGNPIGIPPTVTNGTGFYSISPLPPGTYVVGFEPLTATKLLPTEATATVISSNVTVNVTLQPGNLFSGFVRDSTGVGIFDIDLQVEDKNTGVVLNTPGDNTDSTGFYDVVIPSGEFKLKWRSVGPNAQPWIAVEIKPVSIVADTTIDITMVIGVFVTGTAMDTFGSPVANVNLDFIDSTTGVKLDTAGDNTDSTGFYRVHVPMATYTVRAKPRVLDKLVAVEVSGAQVNADTVINFLLTPGVSLSGTVSNSLAAGVLGVDVDVEDSVTEASILTPFDVTDILGNYSIVVPPGLFDIVFEPPVVSRLAPIALRTVSVTGDMIINVTVPDGLLLSGTILDNLANGVPGVDIDAKVAATGLAVPLVGDGTDAFGVFSVIIQPGVYNLEIEPPRATKLVAQRLLSLPLAQDTLISVTVAPGALVTGTVTDTTGATVANVNVDAFTALGGIEIFTPGDHTNSLGLYSMVVPTDTYKFVFKPDSLSGVTDSLVLSNEVVAGDRVIDVQFPFVVATGIRGGGPPEFGAFSLRQNYPNPFNPSTVIEFTVHDAANIQLNIYDVSGRLVDVLQNEPLAPGRYAVQWDGTDRRGREVASGVYFYRLIVGESSKTLKMILLK